MTEPVAGMELNESDTEEELDELTQKNPRDYQKETDECCSAVLVEFRGRYFRNASPFKPIRSYSPSYGWHSISSVRTLVNKGLIKRSSISVWNDLWLPTIHMRLANNNQQISQSDLTVDSLINANSRTWNSQHFANNRRYTVKSGYQVERACPDSGSLSTMIGSTNPFQGTLLKKSVSTKNQTFFFVATCYRVYIGEKEFESLGDTRRYQMHTVVPQMKTHQFAWILWYIQKTKSSNVFSNLDMYPRDTFKLVEMEAATWHEAQNLLQQQILQNRETLLTSLPSIKGRWCFMDVSWKAHDTFSGQGWYITLEGFDGVLSTESGYFSRCPRKGTKLSSVYFFQLSSLIILTLFTHSRLSGSLNISSIFPMCSAHNDIL
ncbi:hypothetical protein N665_0282s0001 [Sinapis alba]|nr:hypothetical protein N665_0282s0001 [Sinapis alba]